MNAKEKKNDSSGQVRDPSPSYESERKTDETEVPAGDPDSSQTKGTDSHTQADEEDGEETHLNQSEIQEGPKGGRPSGERRSA